MFEKIEVQKSKLDASVNFISRDPDVGMIEARFVQRTSDYFIVYLSSQTGCFLSCRFCHLTATGQNKYENVEPEDFLSQARTVLAHYDDQGIQAPKVHFNFMSRGEPLDNPIMLADSTSILAPLAGEAEKRNLDYRFLISTIMPETMSNHRLIDVFQNEALYPEIYYSIYSVDSAFRRRWLPRALPVERALDQLTQWQDVTGKIPKIHFAFIKGENDSDQDVRNLCQAINEVRLKVNFNIVRYNPYSAKYGEESDIETIERNVRLMEDLLKPDLSTIVAKVGFDVKASCGMFVQ